MFSQIELRCNMPLRRCFLIPTPGLVTQAVSGLQPFLAAVIISGKPVLGIGISRIRGAHGVTRLLCDGETKSLPQNRRFK